MANTQSKLGRHHISEADHVAMLRLPECLNGRDHAALAVEAGEIFLSLRLPPAE